MLLMLLAGEPKQGGVTWFVVATSFEEVEMRNPVQPQDIKKRLQEGLQAAGALSGFSPLSQGLTGC